MQDLPYEGKLSARCNSKPCEGIDFALLEETVGHKGEGKLILAALTGVRVSKKPIPPLVSLEGQRKNLDLKALSDEVASEGQKSLKQHKLPARGDSEAKTERIVRYESINTDRRGTTFIVLIFLVYKGIVNICNDGHSHILIF